MPVPGHPLTVNDEIQNLFTVLAKKLPGQGAIPAGRPRVSASVQFQPMRAIFGWQAGIRIDPTCNADLLFGLLQR